MNTREKITLSVIVPLAAVGVYVSTSSADAKHCDIIDKKSKQVVNTYEGKCEQRKFGGPWGDAAVTEHKPNAEKEAKDAEIREQMAAKAKAKADRIERIKGQCEGQQGLMRDLCDHALED